MQIAIRTSFAALADLGGNGDPDIAVGNDKPGKKLIYKYDGRGRFKLAGALKRAAPFRLNAAVCGLAIGDLDGQGSPDIAAARSDALDPVRFNGR